MYEWKEFLKPLESLSRKHGRHRVFEDFLNICICCFAIEPNGVSRYEEDYLVIIAKYSKEEHQLFSTLFAQLIILMERYNQDSGMGNDILGIYFEQYLSDKGLSQYFTPYPIARFMAEIQGIDEEKEVRILDPACGSGRMLLAAGDKGGKHHRFYGIDLSLLCVKITAVNLFLNGLQGEVMCANALAPNDFRLSYRIRRPPFGITIITQKESSELWHMHNRSFTQQLKKKENEQLYFF